MSAAGLPSRGPVAERVASFLEPYLGPLNAKVAVKTFAQRRLQTTPEALTTSDLPALLEGLRPMLHTFIGKTSTDALLATIEREVR